MPRHFTSSPAAHAAELLFGAAAQCAPISQVYAKKRWLAAEAAFMKQALTCCRRRRSAAAQFSFQPSCAFRRATYRRAAQRCTGQLHAKSSKRCTSPRHHLPSFHLRTTTKWSPSASALFTMPFSKAMFTIIFCRSCHSFVQCHVQCNVQDRTRRCKYLFQLPICTASFLTPFTSPLPAFHVPLPFLICTSIHLHHVPCTHHLYVVTIQIFIPLIITIPLSAKRLSIITVELISRLPPLAMRS